MRELLIFLWINLVVIAWFIAYANLFHRQISTKKHVSFWLINAILTTLGVAGVYWLLLVLKQGVVMRLNNGIGKVGRFIYDLLYLKYVLGWLLIPVILAFIYFGVRSLWLFIRKRSSYMADESSTTKPWAKEFIGSTDGSDNQSLTKQPKLALLARLKHSEHDKDNPSGWKLTKHTKAKKVPRADKLPESVHFINTDMQKIRYQSLSGIQKAFLKARRGGLQITEIDAGYFAVYADEVGRNQLMALINDYSFDVSQLSTAPTCAIVTPRTIESYTLDEYGAKLKEGTL